MSSSSSDTAARPLTPLRQAYADSQATIAALLAGEATRKPEGAFSVSLERDSKGVTKPTVVVRQCDEFPTLAACEAAATALFDRLAAKYPSPSPHDG